MSRGPARGPGSQDSVQADRGPSITAPDGWEGGRCLRATSQPQVRAGARDPDPGPLPRGAAPTFGLRQGLRGKSQAFFLCGPRRGRVDRPRAPATPGPQPPRGSRLHFDPTPSPAIWDGHRGEEPASATPSRARPLLLPQEAAHGPTFPASPPAPAGVLQGASAEKAAHQPAAAAGSAPRVPATPRDGPAPAPPPPRRNHGSFRKSRSRSAPASEPSTNPGPFCGIASPRPTVSPRFTARYVNAAGRG